MGQKCCSTNLIHVGAQLRMKIQFSLSNCIVLVSEKAVIFCQIFCSVHKCGRDLPNKDESCAVQRAVSFCCCAVGAWHFSPAGFECHGSWEENGTRLLVASAVSSQRHYCIAVLAQRVQFAESPPACTQGLLWPWLSFELTHTDSCDSHETGAATGQWPLLPVLVAALPMLLAAETLS